MIISAAGAEWLITRRRNNANKPFLKGWSIRDQKTAFFFIDFLIK